MTGSRFGTTILHEPVERIGETSVRHVPNRDNVGGNRKHEDTPPKDLLSCHILT